MKFTKSAQEIADTVDPEDQPFYDFRSYLLEYDEMTETMKLVANVVAAYAANNTVSSKDLPGLISSVSAAFASLGQPDTLAEPAPKATPAVPIKKSITPDYLICLEDGKKLKMLKRHLRTSYNLSPEDYRAKWGLSAEYPMVAPNYSQARSNLATASGLGRKGQGGRRRAA